MQNDVIQFKVDCRVDDPRKKKTFSGIAHVYKRPLDKRFTLWYAAIQLHCTMRDLNSLTKKSGVTVWLELPTPARIEGKDEVWDGECAEAILSRAWSDDDLKSVDQEQIKEELEEQIRGRTTEELKDEVLYALHAIEGEHAFDFYAVGIDQLTPWKRATDANKGK